LAKNSYLIEKSLIVTLPVSIESSYCWVSYSQSPSSEDFMMKGSLKYNFEWLKGAQSNFIDLCQRFKWL